MLQLRQGVLMQKLEQQAVLLDTHSARYFELNQTAVDLVTALQAGEPEDALISRLAAHYQVAPDRLRADLASLLAALREQALLA